MKVNKNVLVYLTKFHIRIFQNAFKFVGPNYNTLISRSRGKSFPISCISHTVDSLLVTFERLHQSAVCGIINENSVSCSNYQPGAIRTEAEIPYTEKKATKYIIRNTNRIVLKKCYMYLSSR